MPEEPFTAPKLAIVSASLSASDAHVLNYTYTVTLNSAKSMKVTAAVTTDGGAQVGSGGPFDHSSSGTSSARTINMSWSTWPASVTLKLTGTYQEKGVTKTLTAAKTLTVPEEPFTAPKLAIASAELDTADAHILNYTYTVTLNSAASMTVTAAVTSDGGEEVGSDGPFDHTDSGTSPAKTINMSWSTWPTSVTLELTGTYQEKGVTKTLTAKQPLPVPEEPFVDPTLAITEMELEDLEEFAIGTLDYAYSVSNGSASSLTVTAVVTDNNGDLIGEDTVRSYTAPDNYSGPIDLFFSSEPTTLTLTLTGTYEQDGETKTITDTRTIPLTLVPDNFDAEGRAELSTSAIYYYAFLVPRIADPHAADYDFEIAGFTVCWLDSADAEIRTDDLTEAAAETTLIEKDVEYDPVYTFATECPADIPDDAVIAVVTLTVRDRSTGKTYTLTSALDVDE